MHWNAAAVQQNPGRALRLFIGLYISLEAVEIVGGAFMRLGSAITSGDEVVRAAPVYALMLWLVLWLMWKRGYLQPGQGLPERHGVVPVLLAGCALGLAVNVFGIKQQQAHYVFFQYSDYPTFLVLSGVWQSTKAPIVEEILYRGLLFGALRVRGRVLAYGLCTAVFTISHISPLILAVHGRVSLEAGHAITLTIMSLIYAYTYERTRRLFVPMVIHAVTNAAVVFSPAVRYGIELLLGTGL